MTRNNIDGQMECEDCGKMCQGIQGIRGHRRGCPGRQPGRVNQVRQSEDAVVEPAQQVVRGNEPTSMGTRLDADAVEVVLHIYELVRESRLDLWQYLRLREWMESVGWTTGKPNYEDWMNLGRDVAGIEVATERILQQARISRDEPWALYQVAISVKGRWVLWRRNEAQARFMEDSVRKNHENQEGKVNDEERVMREFGIPELEANLNDVIEKLRWLTAHTRAIR